MKNSKFKIQNSKFILIISVLLSQYAMAQSIPNDSLPTQATFENITFTGKGITYVGNSLDFFSPAQAPYIQNKPVLSISKWGELNFYGRPALNFNALFLKQANDFQNGLKYTNNWGGITNIGGPVLYGANGGMLGTKSIGWDGAETPVLSWDTQKNVKIHGTLVTDRVVFANGTVLTTGGGNWNITNNYLTYPQNINVLGELKIGHNSLHLGSTTPTSNENRIYATDGDLEIYTEMGGSIGDIRLQKNSNRAVKIGGGINGNAVNNSIVQLEVFSGARIHGTIQTTDVCITPNAFCDYVFDESYSLMPLKNVEQYITKHKHLPEVPSEKEVIANGLKLNEIVLLQMKKIEELTLYLIEQNKKIEALEKQINK